MYYMLLLTGPMGELLKLVNECPYVMGEALIHAQQLEITNPNITIMEYGFDSEIIA